MRSSHSRQLIFGTTETCASAVPNEIIENLASTTGATKTTPKIKILIGQERKSVLHVWHVWHKSVPSSAKQLREIGSLSN